MTPFANYLLVEVATLVPAASILIGEYLENMRLTSHTCLNCGWDRNGQKEFATDSRAGDQVKSNNKVGIDEKW